MMELGNRAPRLSVFIAIKSSVRMTYKGSFMTSCVRQPLTQSWYMVVGTRYQLVPHPASILVMDWEVPNRPAHHGVQKLHRVPELNRMEEETSTIFPSIDLQSPVICLFQTFPE